MNAILGRFRPGAAGFDVMHFNTHKTFSTPHGGGGPGAGPVAVAERLLPFLPEPLVVRDDDGSYRLERPGERPSTIGRVRAYQGSVGVLVRAYAYIRTHGGTGLRQVSDDAVLAANYLRQRVSEAWDMPYPGPCKHEFVASGGRLRQETGVRTLDVAKRLIDYGFHAPTMSFPVAGTLMVEPTESEPLEELAEVLLGVLLEGHALDPVLDRAGRAGRFLQQDGQASLQGGDALVNVKTWR